MLEKRKDLQKQVHVPAFCSKYKRATLRTWKTSTKRSKGAEGLHDTIESTSNAFLEDTEIVSAYHAASAAAYRVPRSWQSLDLLLQVVPFLYVLWKQPKTLDAPSNLWKPLKAPEPAAPKPENALEPAKKQFFLHGIVHNKNRPGHSLHEKNWHSRAPRLEAF